MLIQLTECYDRGTKYFWRKTECRNWEFHNELQKKKDMRNCEKMRHKPHKILELKTVIMDRGITCIVYRYVCLIYRVRGKIYVQWCVSEVQGEGNVTVYSDVCLRYREREMLLCTVMCVWGTGWGKCYCVQWCVSEVQSEGNVTVYSDVCLRYRVREMLLWSVMFV